MPLTVRRGRGLLASMRTTLVLTLGVSVLSLWSAGDRGGALLLPVAAAATPAAPSAAAAARPSAGAATPPTAAPKAVAPAKFGAPLSAKPALSAQAVLADPKKFDDKDIKLTGQVGGVCQAKGCWMTIGTGEPGAASVRVRFKDYAFFVPKDCMGKTAVVEGHFKLTTLSVAEAQHYADDAAKEGATPKKIATPQSTLALMATGVELL